MSDDSILDALDLHDIAKRMKIRHSTAKRLAQDQKIPAKRVGRQWRMAPAALEEYLRARDSDRRPDRAPHDGAGASEPSAVDRSSAGDRDIGLPQKEARARALYRAQAESRLLGDS